MRICNRLSLPGLLRSRATLVGLISPVRSWKLGPVAFAAFAAFAIGKQIMPIISQYAAVWKALNYSLLPIPDTIGAILIGLADLTRPQETAWTTEKL